LKIEHWRGFQPGYREENGRFYGWTKAVAADATDPPSISYPG
jgi:hypothetical protein